MRTRRARIGPGARATLMSGCNAALDRYRQLDELLVGYALFALSADGRFAGWNAGAETMFGFRREEVLGRPYALLFTAEDVANGWPEIELIEATAGRGDAVGMWLVRKDGSRFWCVDPVRPVRDNSGTVTGFLKLPRETRFARRNHRRSTDRGSIERQTARDPITHLPTRESFYDLVKRSLRSAKEHAGSRFVVIFVDIDHFEDMANRLGSGAADDLLVQVARVLERCVRPEDVVARFGGDRFAISLGGLAGATEAAHVADRIETELQHSIYLDGVELYTTVSMGIAIGVAADDGLERAMRDAEAAAHEAKSLGPSRRVTFDEGLQARADRHLDLQMDLRRAVARGEFFVEYQPIVSLARHCVVGFEALVRWRHPERDVLSPAEFIPEAEAIGMMPEIDRFVLREACRQIRAWQLDFADDDLSMSVNVSSNYFANKYLVSEIEQALRQNGLSARSLKIEITETVLMEDFAAAVSTASALGEHGVEIYIDDFGTGYSSLGRLMQLPLHVLKVDRSFVNQIALDSRRVEIARTVVALAHALGLVAVAEGIETEAQRTTLLGLGCEFGQGFWFSRPLGAEDARALIGRELPLSR